VHGLRCYGNLTRTRNVSEYMLVICICNCIRDSFLLMPKISTRSAEAQRHNKCDQGWQTGPTDFLPTGTNTAQYLTTLLNIHNSVVELVNYCCNLIIIKSNVLVYKAGLRADGRLQKWRLSHHSQTLLLDVRKRGISYIPKVPYPSPIFLWLYHDYYSENK